MLLDLPIQQIIKEIGHDGSEILWPNDPRPHMAFSMQEITDIAIRHRVALVPIHGYPVSVDSNDENPVPIFKDHEARLIDHMTGNPGLITGYYSPDKFHLVAWDGAQVYDPMDGRIYNFDQVGQAMIAVETFYRAFRF